jgi:hypothetical protein
VVPTLRGPQRLVSGEPNTAGSPAAVTNADEVVVDAVGPPPAEIAVDLGVSGLAHMPVPSSVTQECNCEDGVGKQWGPQVRSLLAVVDPAEALGRSARP